MALDNGASDNRRYDKVIPQLEPDELATFSQAFSDAKRYADAAQRIHFERYPDSEGFAYWESVAFHIWANRR